MYISKEALSPVWYYSKATLEYDWKSFTFRNPQSDKANDIFAWFFLKFNVSINLEET